MLSTRVALVTGAAQGIGLAISAALLKLGAKVCIRVSILKPCVRTKSRWRSPFTLTNQVSLLDVREDLGKAACKELQKEHTADSMTFYHCDVTDRTQLVRQKNN